MLFIGKDQVSHIANLSNNLFSLMMTVEGDRKYGEWQSPAGRELKRGAVTQGICAHMVSALTIQPWCRLNS